MNAGYGKIAAVAGLIAMTALAGCREQEQGRPLAYDKGVYQGKPDQGLDEATLEALRVRAQRQSYN